MSGETVLNTIEILVLVLVAIFIAYNLSILLSAWRQKGRSVSDITEANPGQELNWQVYYFYSPTCGACRNMTPILEKRGRKNCSVVCVDVSVELELARLFSVRATPTAVLIENGKISKVLLGTGLLEQVNQFIKEHENDEN
jgi:thioredoxin 1